MIAELIHFKKKKILVVGDFMIDSYTRGSVKRVSPEAPVCVVKVEKQELLPGGAGNVALNVEALGSSVSVCGRIGEDKASVHLLEALMKKGIDIEGLIVESGYETPLKNRILAQHQQLLRIDFEKDQPVLRKTEERLVNYVQSKIALFDLVLISDYSKGLLSNFLLERLISIARAHSKPIFVDPKGVDFTRYQNVTLIKPNRQEAYLAASLDEKSPIQDVGKLLLEKTQVDYLLITRSEKGMTLFDRYGHIEDFPALAKEVVDVTGAGDTVLATLAVAYASGLELSRAIKVANIAASLAIEKIGCAHIGKKELWEAVMASEVRYKYLPYLGEETLELLFSEEKFVIYSLQFDKMHWALLTDIEELKLRHPELKLAVIVPDDLDEGIIRNLCALKQLDLIVPESLLVVMQSFLYQEQYT